MPANWQHGVLKLMRIKDHPIQVTGYRDITPWYRRVDFDTGDFLDQVDIYPTMWVRLWIPSIRKEGLIVQRGYSLVDPDPARRSFSLDFVLHEPEGAAGRWAANIDEGAKVEISYTPQPIFPDPDLSTYVLAGDTSALPAINSLLEALPSATRTAVFIEEAHTDREQLPLVEKENTVVTWLDPTEDGSAVADAIAALGVDPDDTFVWVAGEMAMVRRAKALLRNDLGLPKENYRCQPYWTTKRKGD